MTPSAREPEVLPNSNLEHNLYLHGANREMFALLTEDEGAAQVVCDVIEVYRSMLDRGRRTAEETFNVRRHPAIQGSTIARNLSHAGLSKEGVNLLIEDPNLAFLVVQALTVYADAKRADQAIFTVSFSLPS